MRRAISQPLLIVREAGFGPAFLQLSLALFPGGGVTFAVVAPTLRGCKSLLNLI